MSAIGNILWIIFGGLLMAIGWCIAGILLCITIIGIPFGVQCFKIGSFVLTPFGKEIRSGSVGAGGLIGNILWILIFGWELALAHLIHAIVLAVTIVGIPFAIQHVKLSGLALAPFGARAV